MNCDFNFQYCKILNSTTIIIIFIYTIKEPCKKSYIYGIVIENSALDAT